MLKRLEHLYWKAGTFGKNCLISLLFISLFAITYGCSLLNFWFQIKVVDFLFGL
ncbi:MAG: hypothetical protein ACRC7S_10050 [Cetobacterium sp.]